MKRGLIEGNEHEQPAGLDESVSFKPGTLSRLDVLSIAHELGPLWKMFGRVLEVPDAVIDQIEADESKVSDKCYSVLRRWQEIYPQDATYHCLARALQHPAVGRKDLAVKYCCLQLGTSFEPENTAQAIEAREPKKSKDFTDLSSYVPPKRKREIEKNETEQPAAHTLSASCIIEWIREVCQKREGVIVPVPWCEEFSFHIKDIFTRLRIVEKEKTRGIVTSKAVTSITSIFTPHDGCEQPVIVLIEGEPGMGKTTYCQKLVYDWASKQCPEWDESFPRIDVLLLLRCREIKSGNLWDAIEDQILPKTIEREARKMFFQFLKENPSKVLLVLDGLDEADPQKLEMYLDLVQKRELPGCYIVLTSRQEGGSRVRRYTDTLLEIVGFTPTDAESYIRKYFKQDKAHLAEELISKISSHYEYRELTQNPLNTLLLCVIFEDLEGVLPNSRTQLYMEIVLFILRRYESKEGLSSRGKDLLLVYKKELMILGRTALDSLRKQELYFDDHKGDIKESLLMKFGFLSIQSGVSKRAPCDRYGFFHKSFQEFFSGYFLAFSIIDDVANSQSVLTDPRYMGELFQVFKFMSTIIAKESVETAVSVVKRIASILNETGLTSDKLVSYLKVAHSFVIECKTCSGDPDDTKLACTFGESLELIDVDLESSCYSGQWYIETFFKALAFNSTVKNFKLNLSTDINLLPEALRVSISLSSAKFPYYTIGKEGANSLAQALRVNTSLSHLSLRLNFIVDEVTKSLAQALRVNTSLSCLSLPDNSIA
ncbi:PREDICTED: protein NLRC5-like [Acropora digitifera]|uniref:protein NLRC5-like n=1 Tax=Acropora digitifera TaxID=70779 RepID=UPI00077AD9F8|nr:PREDICTED: protein NLRC5-like [Acropora digitifera]